MVEVQKIQWPRAVSSAPDNSDEQMARSVTDSILDRRDRQLTGHASGGVPPRGGFRRNRWRIPSEFLADSVGLFGGFIRTFWWISCRIPSDFLTDSVGVSAANGGKG